MTDSSPETEASAPKAAPRRGDNAIVAVETGLVSKEKSKGRSTLLLAQSALMAGLCRFVPIPLLDDFLEKNVQRFMIAMLLKKADRDYHTSHVEALYAGSSNFFDGIIGWLVRLPFKLIIGLLKKAFKSVFVFLLIREAGLAIGETLMLGQSIERALRNGRFEKDDDPAAFSLRQEAFVFRKAFDAAFAGTDRRFLAQLLGSVFTQVKSLPRLGARAVRLMFGRRGLRGEEPGELPEASREVVERGVQDLQQRMEDEEIKSFFEDFYDKFEVELHRQEEMARSSLQDGQSV